MRRAATTVVCQRRFEPRAIQRRDDGIANEEVAAAIERGGQRLRRPRTVQCSRADDDRIAARPEADVQGAHRASSFSIRRIREPMPPPRDGMTMSATSR